MSILERTRTSTPPAVALPIGPRTAAVLVLASIGGLMMLCWPLLLVAQPGDRVEPPFIFLALLPLVMVVVLAEMGEGGMDSRVLAVLGVLSAINAVMRGLGAGTAGIELVFFLLVLGGRVFGAGFGFVLGCTSLFASAPGPGYPGFAVAVVHVHPTPSAGSDPSGPKPTAAMTRESRSFPGETSVSPAT